MHSVRQTNPKLGSCKRTTLPGKEVGGEKWQARDKGSSEASQGGDEHWESRIIAKSEDGADMGFGRITSGKALGACARGNLSCRIFFFVFVKIPTIQPAWLLVYPEILFSCTINLVYVNALEAKFCKKSTHVKRIPTFNTEGAHHSTRLKACTCPKRDTLASPGK